MLYEELGTSGRKSSHTLIMLAICEHKLGNRARAHEIYEEARTGADEVLRAAILGNLGNMALEEQDFARARACIDESVEINRRLGQPAYLANNLMDIGFIALAEARLDEAEAALRESLGLCRAEGLGDLLLWVVEGVTAVLLGRGSPIDAVRLLSATTRPRAEMAVGGDFFPIAEEMRERTLDAARAQLSEEAFARAWAEGEALSLEEAAEQAARV
jgi:tetratricopeptide (TPR) repeat protein